jgi:predicted SAM-dependent methyltransferase
MVKRAALKAIKPAEPIRLDLGCGKTKPDGWVGVDTIAFPGVDHVCHLGRERWPFADGSVEEARSMHALEHLAQGERVHFANELYRVLRAGGKAQIVTPDWSHACAYGDPTHQWPPMSSWAYQYWNAAWRKSQAPHTDIEHNPAGLSCDFEFVIAGGWDAWLNGRNDEFRMFAMQHYLNSYRDLIVHLTKR